MDMGIRSRDEKASPASQPETAINGENLDGVGQKQVKFL